MKEYNKNLEQLLPDVSSQGEETLQNINNRVEEIKEQGSKFGKFKNVDDLINAYNNLQTDYTKKCQALSQFQKEEKDNDFITPNISGFNWAEKAEEFFANNTRAKKYEDKLARIIVEDKEISSSLDPLNNAWNKFISSKFLDEDELINNEEFLQKYVFNNNDIRNKIVKDYFNSINISKTPTLIASQKGSESVLTPVTKPKTIKEARKLVEEMFD